VSKPRKPLLQKSSRNRKRKFEETLREKEAAARARAAREQQERDEARIGYKMPDGTIHAGVSPDTGKKIYAMPADAPLAMTFDAAAEYAKAANSQKACGHDDWRVPTKSELNVLFNNRAAIGGFDVSGSYPAGWYWSATPGTKWSAWCQRFSDGDQCNGIQVDRSSVRLVRVDGPKP
jgi:hypothetical protein